ncbi:MAG TPA: hypothetical protein VJU61_09270, partial [Polyangiaceae bacterium]|nr:hypothetical protein [Polyangiaceae bacterium]
GAGVTLLQRLHQPAPAPSSLVPELPEGWDELVASCLKPQREQRYSDAGQALSAFAGLWLDAPAERPRRCRLSIEPSNDAEPAPSGRRALDTLPLDALALDVLALEPTPEARTGTRTPTPRTHPATAAL